MFRSDCTVAAADLGFRCSLMACIMFQKKNVCVEVLNLVKPNGVMSSAVSLPDRTFYWAGLVLKAVNQYSVCTNCQAAYVMKRKNQYLKIAHAVKWRFSDTQAIHTMAASLSFSFQKTLIYFSYFFSEKTGFDTSCKWSQTCMKCQIRMTFHANSKRRQFAWTVKFYFLRKNKTKKFKMSSAEI